MARLILITLSLLMVGCQASNEDIQNESNSNKQSSNNNPSPYLGSWPYNPDKEVINNPGFGSCPEANGCECDTSDTCPENSECTQLFRGKYCVPKVGSIIPRFKGIDQFGDIFDLYDLANQGKPILLEIGSASSKAGRYLSAWRSSIDDEATKQKWWKNKFNRVQKLIDNQDIYWVHIIHLDANKNSATGETARLWYEDYPHDNIIVLSDPEGKMKTWVRPTGLPCMLLIDDKMTLQVHTLRGIEDALDRLYDILN
jgi:hypothetical protein